MAEPVNNGNVEVLRSYLVPSDVGAEFAAASHRTDARRNILWGLLRGAAGRPVPVAQLTEWTGTVDRRELASILFRMQREGMLNGGAKPFKLPPGAYDELLEISLKLIAGNSSAVLANAQGLCVSHAGCTREQAQRLALVASTLSPLVRTTGHDATELAMEQIINSIRDKEGEEYIIRPLYLHKVGFFLITPRTNMNKPAERASAFAQLIAILGRRYLGEC